jgi:hypothetical protein
LELTCLTIWRGACQSSGPRITRENKQRANGVSNRASSKVIGEFLLTKKPRFTAKTLHNSECQLGRTAKSDSAEMATQLFTVNFAIQLTCPHDCDSFRINKATAANAQLDGVIRASFPPRSD